MAGVGRAGRPCWMNLDCDSNDEVPLSGGNVRRVVRAGNTVRRDSTAFTETVMEVMLHARNHGVPHIPLPMGLDHLNREVIEFIEGEVPHEQPQWLWNESILVEAGQWLRLWHDATVSFCSPNKLWGFPSHHPAETVCHNDFAPYNSVFRNHQLVGVIDFDFCAPGPRIRDLAWTAYRFVPMQPPADARVDDGGQERSHFTIPELLRRLDVFLNAYLDAAPVLDCSPGTLLAAMVARLNEVADWTETHATTTGRSELQLHGRMYRAHAHWIAETLLS
jgi:hypothetical protein